MPSDTYQIGEVAARTGLSLRTLRYYEAVGLVTPSGRTEGRFRLYAEPDVQRLLLIRSLRPVESSLGELHELFDLHDRLAAAAESDPTEHPDAAARLQTILDLATQSLRLQRERLIAAELAVELLRRPLTGASSPSEEAAVAVDQTPEPAS